MKIIIDSRPLLEKKRGGVSHYTDSIARALLERGRHQYVLFCNARDPDESRLRLADLPPAERRIGAVPNRLLNAGFAFFGRPLIESMAGAADLLYLPNLNFAATKLPSVVTVHDLSFIHYPDFFPARGRLWHRLVNAPELLERAAAIAAVSEHTKADLVETLGIEPEKISVVPPGADDAFRPQTPERIREVRKRYRLPERFFLYLGTIEPRKNLATLIAAFDKLPETANLVVAGARGWLAEDVYAGAGRTRSRARINFLDYVDDADRPALYGAALALVYPSFYEGFGMPPLEAMASGTPVIASRAASLGEVVGSAGILVDPCSVSELAEAMAALAADAALAETLRARGLKQAQKYSWIESAEKLERVFESVR